MAFLRAKVTVRARLRKVFKTLPIIIDPVVLKEDAGTLLVRRIKARFEKGVDTEGKAWRVKKDGSASTLKKSTDLYESIKVAQGNVAGAFINTRAGFRIIADAAGDDGFPYGIVHQRGRPENNTPKREFLGVSSDDVKALTRQVQRKIDNATRFV